MTVLSEDEVKQTLVSLEGWDSKGKEIEKLYTLRNFIDAIGFVNKIAILAEKADHHPDILIQYKKVKISLSTHSEGGITEKDINLAKEIDNLTNN